jgi:uncharacterized membrane protein
VPAPPPYVLPSAEDPLVAELSGLVGGPVGRHARVGERRSWTVVRVLMALAVLAALLGWAEKSTCRVHPYSHEYQYTRLCYTDVFVLYGVEGLAQGQQPYLQHKVEYPVLIGAAMYVVSELDSAIVPVADRNAEFFDITALLLGLATVATVLATARTHRSRPWDAAMVALAPAMVLNLDVNWDMIAVAFTAASVLAWSRRRPWLAGVLLGLAVATKFYPLFLLVAFFVLCLRAARMRAFGQLLAGAVVAWLAVDLPIWAAAPHGFAWFYRFSEIRNTEFNSLWYALDYLHYGTGRLISTHRLNLGSGLLLALALLGVALLGLRAPRRPRLPALLFLSAVAFVLTNKVYSPQYVLWLVPLAVLARPRWRFFLFWQLAEVVEFVTLYGFLVYDDTGGSKGVPYPVFFFLGLAPRDIILASLAGVVVYEILHPDADVVRAGGVDDPAGGVLDGAPDRTVRAERAAPARMRPWVRGRAPSPQ